MVSRNIIKLYGVARLLPAIQCRSYSAVKNVLPVFKKVANHPEKIAIRDEYGKYTYQDILLASSKLANEINENLDGKVQRRVALLCPNNVSYVIAQWACWISGQIVVPLSANHPKSILQYLMSDSQCDILIADPLHESRLDDLCSGSSCRPLVLDPSLRESALFKPEDSSEKKTPLDLSAIGKELSFYSENDAMIIFTSGSTGLPKGVVLSFSNLEAQIKSMVKAWEWEDKDCILHSLPLYHIHGIVNALMVPLYVGARCVMLKQFDPSQVWAELVGIKIPSLDRVTLFTAVPTMYAKLIQEYESKLNKSDKIADYIRQTCSQKIRLMLSGSAPLTKSIFERWEEITGQQLVERYGMTETGMVLSAPLSKKRTQGTVGIPMPEVKVRIISDERDGSKRIVAEGTSEGTKLIGNTSSSSASNFRSLLNSPPGGTPVSGVLQVSGPTVSSRYWNKPQATASDFKNGWFNTGDIVEYCNGSYTIMGRVSSDIIKTGGFKVSALQVETVLSEHEAIADIAVVPLEDPVWGEKVGAMVVLREGFSLDVDKLQRWASDRLPDYAVPRIVMEAPQGFIPRNHMGKVNRASLRDAFIPQQSASASASA